MIRKAAVVLLGAVLVVGMQGLIRIVAAADKPAGDGTEFIGKWEKPEGEILDVITIARDGDDWSLSGTYYQGGKEVGSFIGKNVKFQEGKLSYVTHIEKPPPGKGGGEGAQITLTFDDGKITEHWQVGKSRGSHTWTRAAKGSGSESSKSSSVGSSKSSSVESSKSSSLTTGGDAIKVEMEKLEGTYSCVSTEQDGMQGDAEQIKKLKLVVKDKKWTVYINDKVSTLATFMIDPGKKPKTIDLTGTQGGDKGLKYLGIYELEGDNLKLCIGDTKMRPKVFDGKSGSGRQFEVWKRMKD